MPLNIKSLSKYTIVGAGLGLLVCVSVVVLGFLYTFSQPTAFETSARIWVQPKLAEMVPSSYQTSLYAPLTAFFNSPIATAGEVLRSDVVLDEAITRLKAKLPPSECPTAGDLKGGVSVASVSNADILQIRFRYKEPKACQIALDTLLDAFIHVNSTQASTSATQSRIFLEKQLVKAQEDSMKARRALMEFESANKTLDFAQQVDYQLKGMSEIEGYRQKSETSIQQLQTKIDFLQGQLRLKPEDALIAQRLSLDAAIKELREAIGHDEVALIEARAKFKEEHPRIQQLKAIVEESKRALKDRMRELVGEAGLSRAAEGQIYGADPVQQRLLGELVDARAEQLAEETKVASYNEQIEAIKAKLAQLPTQQQQLAELRRSADVAKQILSDTERNLHSIRLLEAVATRASNIQILDRPGPAMPTEQKTTFSIGVSLILGLMLGAGTFYGVYLLNPAVLRLRDVFNILPLPVVGWVNRPAPEEREQEVLPGLEHLRINVRSWLTRDRNRVVITSGDPDDGKTVLAAGLAVALAQSGLRVLVIDLNFVHPSIHEVLGAARSPGISDYLSSPDHSVPESMIRSIKSNLKVITAGSKAVGNGALETPAFKEFMKALIPHFDAIIMDTAATSESSEALSLLEPAVHLLVSVRLRHTYRDSLRLLAGQLRYQDCARSGLVLFDIDERSILAALSMSQPGEETLAPVPPAAEPEAAESGRW